VRRTFLEEFPSEVLQSLRRRGSVGQLPSGPVDFPDGLKDNPTRVSGIDGRKYNIHAIAVLIDYLTKTRNRFVYDNVVLVFLPGLIEIRAAAAFGPRTRWHQ
jgi:hypothetical protein